MSQKCKFFFILLEKCLKTRFNTRVLHNASIYLFLNCNRVVGLHGFKKKEDYYDK